MVTQKNQQGIVHFALIIVIVIALIGIVLFFLYKGSSRSKVTTLKPAETQTTTGSTDQPQKEAENPFEDTEKYSNPFEENKNPFDYLNE